MAKKGVVVLRGLHVAVHMPTEERLMVQIIGLTPEQFRSLAAELEDWFVVVDEAYKKTATRGRGWKGRGKRVSERKRMRVLRFSPFPSSFSNVLRMIRRNIYITLHRNCLVLAGEQHGGYRQNIYILPYANAPAFMKAVQAFNKQIDELNMQIAEFQKTRHFEDLKEILKRNEVEVRLNGDWRLDHIRIDVTPLALEPTTVKELVEEEYKKMFRELEEEERRGLEALHEELERKRREIVTKSVEDLQKKISEIVNKIVAAKRLSVKEAKKRLEQIRTIAVSVGLESLATSVIDPLAAVVEDPSKTMEVFGTKNLGDGVNMRIKALLEAL